MTTDTNNIYWNTRFTTFGHTGWGDEAMYTYDQPLRLKAIDKALRSVKIYIKSDMNILDVGCGTGDLAVRFAQNGANVVGIDISNKTIEYAKERLSNYDNVELLTGNLVDASFDPDYFNLVTSITVLQHITEIDSFNKAVKTLVEITKKKGCILILETSPVLCTKPNHNSNYQAIRTRSEWIKVFENEGCRLIYQRGLPQLGVLVVRILKFALKMITNPFGKINESENEQKANSEDIPQLRVGLVNVCFKYVRKILLIIIKPIEIFFMQFPNFSSIRIMVFKKEN